MRGFDIRGVGPRIIREQYDANGNIIADDKDVVSDALGGRAYYMGRLELEFPTSSTLRSFGLRPSAFVDVGSVWKLTTPLTEDIIKFCTAAGQPTQEITPADHQPQLHAVQHRYVTGYSDASPMRSPDSASASSATRIKPRLSVGIGVNWVSPFGPLRIDLAKAILKEEGDETKLFSFNVGTQF